MLQKLLRLATSSWLFLMIFIFTYNSAFSQAPPMRWQWTDGGSENDYPYCIISLGGKNGYVIAGMTQSDDKEIVGFHTVTGVFGLTDGWVLRTNDTGVFIWQKCLGGTNNDFVYDGISTPDGGYIFAGQTGSNDGDVSGNHTTVDTTDGWLVKLDGSGNISWQKCLGGSNYDLFNSVALTSSGYIMAGTTLSSDGDVSGKHGASGIDNIWVVKTDNRGNIIWQKCLGGSSGEYGADVTVGKDGSYIVAGYATSSDGDVTGGVKGKSDYWIVDLDTNGNINWQRTYGGSDEDEAGNIIQTSDGGYLVAGSSASSDGDVSGHHGAVGQADIWLLKLTATGDISWQKSYGGTLAEDHASVQQTLDGGYIFNAETSSTDRDVTGNHGNGDTWVVKLDAAGAIQWQKCLGGSLTEQVKGYHTIVQNADSSYTVASSTSSSDGDVKKRFSLFDFWIVNLDTVKPTGGIYVLNTNNDIKIYPNTTNGIVHIDLPNGFEHASIKLLDISGRQQVFSQQKNIGESKTIDISGLPAGEYILQVINENVMSSYKVIKK